MILDELHLNLTAILQKLQCNADLLHELFDESFCPMMRFRVDVLIENSTNISMRCYCGR